jgi:hypothetical protein
MLGKITLFFYIFLDFGRDLSVHQQHQSQSSQWLPIADRGSFKSTASYHHLTRNDILLAALNYLEFLPDKNLHKDEIQLFLN